MFYFNTYHVFYYALVWFSLLESSDLRNESKLQCNGEFGIINSGNNTTNCTSFADHQNIQCYGHLENLIYLSNDTQFEKLENLFVCNWEEPIFNPDKELSPELLQIQSLTIKYGDLKNITTKFPEMHQLQLINITGTNLSYLDAATFSNLDALKILDLRWNQIKEMDEPIIVSKVFEGIYLLGNPWTCSWNLKWLAESSKKDSFLDRNDLYCVDVNYKRRGFSKIITYKLSLEQICKSHNVLKDCSCSIHHVARMSKKPFYGVNCTNIKLIDMPDYLPKNTSIFYGTNNKITNVQPLRDNEHYTNMIDVYLDDNYISDINILMNSSFLRNFRVLNLKGNLLRTMDVKALDDILGINHYASLIYLSDNPWHCSCKFSMRFREFLLKYQEIVPDAKNVTCTHGIGKDIKSVHIMNITEAEVCTMYDSPINYLHLANGVLCGIIVFTLIKFAYDFYYYKYYGRIPWLARRF